MLTAQDIKEKTFEKAVFGGYDMDGVDTFLETLATDVAALQRENAVLKSKMKVLVDKVEEYRSTEDAMRLALLSAQKMSVQIETDAKATSDQLVEETERACREIRQQAEAEARRIVDAAQNATQVEQARVDRARAASGAYIARVRDLCTEQLRFLDELASLAPQDVQTAAAAPAPQQPVEMEATVKSIEDSVAKLVDGSAPRADFAGEAEQDATMVFQKIRPADGDQ